jgi:hypothetical protein
MIDRIDRDLFLKRLKYDIFIIKVYCKVLMQKVLEESAFAGLG